MVGRSIAPGQPPRKLNRLQVLRFFAATAVVLFHAIAAAGQRGLPLKLVPWYVYGAQGVDLFFVISGCVIYYTVEASGLNGSAFLARRMQRLLPLYWAFTFLMFAIGVMLPGAFSRANGNWMTVGNLIASTLFISVPTGRQTIVFVGWTLEFEVLFYLSTAALLFTGRRPWTILGVGFSIAVVIGRALHPPIGWLQFLTSPLMLEFVMGIVIGEWLFKRHLNRLVVGSLAVALIACIPSYDEVWRVVVGGLPAAALVFLAVRADLKSMIGKTVFARALMVFGDASYSIYLVQVLSIALCFKLVLAVWPTFPLVALIFVASVATLGAGLLSFLLFERPVMQFFRRRRRTRGRPAAEAVEFVGPP
jgi:exopolysaccharide production protein ExoZ